MCGIAGIYSFTGVVDRETIEKFTDSLSHRGPDARGVYINNNIALGHRRLSILDLSEAGSCPMHYVSPAGLEYYITFNGEVYNFIELRNELRSKGYNFKSSTDTEVIVAAYAEWGEECLSRFNGMWAFAIFDVQSREIFLSRDRFGVKPLYYSRHSNQVAFASELKAFTMLPNAAITFNNDIVQPVWERYRYDGKSSITVAKEVHSLLAGHNARIYPNGEMEIRRWWDTRQSLTEVPTSYSQQVEKFRELFLDAVKMRLRSDVPIATCLSGGIDSTAVATAIHYLKNSSIDCGERSTESWQNSFVATFPGSFIDEERFAKEVIKATGLKPHYLPIDAQSGLQCIVDSVWSLDEPSGGLATSVWMLYQKLRAEKVVVSLDGHGGDELLGGYGWYMNLPHNQLNATLFSDFHQDLLPTILRNYDRCSMAHGIEVRMPLMDYRLVSYAHALPSLSKMGGGYLKRILRDATKDFMPPVIYHRQGKIGFNSPLIEWLNGDLVYLLEKVFAHDAFLSLPFNDLKGIASQIVGKCRAQAWKKEDWDLAYKVTVLLNLALWRIMFEGGGRESLRGWLSHAPSDQTRQSLGRSEVELNSSAEVDTPRISNIEFVCIEDSKELNRTTYEYLTKLAEAQVNRPVDCTLRTYCVESENFPGAIVKNRCGTAKEYKPARELLEVGILLSDDSVPPIGSRMLLVREGVRCSTTLPIIYFSDIQGLVGEMEKIMQEDKNTPIVEKIAPRNSDDSQQQVNKLVSDALKALQEREVPKARILIDEALSFNLPVRDLQFVLGLVSLEQGKLQDAKSALYAELQLDPSRQDVREVIDQVLPFIQR